MTRKPWMFTFVIGLALAGCARQQSASQPQQQPETLSSAPGMATDQTLSQAPSAAAQAAAPAAEALPATAGEIGGPIPIQTALANAGYYAGPIDGKVGPMTQQAIKDFQAAQGLTADGKVGTRTWAALKPFLSSEPPAQPAQ